MTLGAVASSKLKLKALSFGGTDERVEFGDQTEYDKERTDSFSLSFWLKWGSGVVANVLNKIPASANFKGYYCVVRSFVEFHIEDTAVAGTNKIFVQTNNTGFDNSAWHHIVITYAGTSLASGVKIYVDKVDQALTTNVNTLPAGSILNNNSLCFGGRPSFSHITGSGADLMFVKKVLSQSEVDELYAFTTQGVPSGVANLSFTSDVVGFWRPTLSDANPALDDLSTANHNGTMQNMEAGDIVSR